MGSLHANSDARWDHEPRAWSADLQVGAFGSRHTAPSWSSALRFMERALTPILPRIGTMNRRLGAPISRSAHSGRAIPRRAGARRSGSWREPPFAFAHALGPGTDGDPLTRPS